MALAVGRSAAENTLVWIDSVAGMMNAAPTPVITRPTMIASGERRLRTPTRLGVGVFRFARFAFAGA